MLKSKPSKFKEYNLNKNQKKILKNNKIFYINNTFKKFNYKKPSLKILYSLQSIILKFLILAPNKKFKKINSLLITNNKLYRIKSNRY